MRWHRTTGALASLATVATVGTAAALAAPRPVAAQEARPVAAEEVSLAGADTVRLGLDEAVSRALELDEQVLVARTEAARTEGLLAEVRARSLPELTVDLDYTRNFQRPVIFFNSPEGVQQISIGQDNELSAALNLTQTLFDFSLGPARAAARLAEEGADARVNASRTDAALEAKLAYYAVLLDRALVTVQEQALAQAQARLEDVQAFFRAGTGSEFDVLTAQVEVDNLRPAVIAARNEYALDLDELKQTVGLPLEAMLVLTDSLAVPEDLAADAARDSAAAEPDADAPDAPRDAAAAAALPGEVPLQAAVRQALNDRYDLRAQRLAVELREKGVDAEEGSALPSFELFASLVRRASSPDMLPAERDFTQSTAVGVSMSLPLFDGGAREGRIQQAMAAADAERFRLRELREDVQLEVQRAHRSLEAAVETYLASRFNVDRAERALEIAQTRFRNGLSTQLELSDAELALTRARSNNVQARHDYWVARARLRAAMGER